MIIQKRKAIWVTLGIVAVLFRWVGGINPEWIEKIYSRGIFQGIRVAIDYLLAWSPIPLIYPFFILLIFFIGKSAYRLYQSSDSLKKKFYRFASSLAAFIGGGIFFFLFIWGFNYGRVPVEEEMGLQLSPLNLDELWKELQDETKQIVRLRLEIPGATDSALGKEHLPVNLERKLRKGVVRQLSRYGYPVPGRVRGRLLYPKGIFLRFSSSGLYFPFTGEGHVDAGLHPLEWPFVMSHEMAHGYGFGDEGTCNFWAYLATAQSHDPVIAYMGRLVYWRTLATNYLIYYPEKYKAFRGKLPAGIQADLNAINENLKKYPDIMPDLRYFAYDTYLKAQGITEGIKNYSRVIMMVKAWRENTEI
ncbi:MAG: membrane protein [Saprospiraceae bacterium]|nr:MAG: membrane protein [Saprospiraceae bacterium]